MTANVETSGRKVVVAISTYERPDGLARLLAALDLQRVPAGVEMCVAVVDNSPGRSAEAVCLARAAVSPFSVDYRHEPRKGLSYGRNAALAAALDAGAALLAFIDDDEMPEPHWLAALVRRHDETGAAVVCGPVLPVFGAPPPRWAVEGGFFAKVPVAADGSLTDAYTSNALVDLTAVRQLGLTFDPRCNETGGEDTLFFRELAQAGYTRAYAAEAAVHEDIPEARIRVGWLWRRWYRTGHTEAMLLEGQGHVLSVRARNLARGLARMGGGALRLALSLPRGLRQPHAPVAAGFTLCRGLGLVTSAFGASYGEYARRRYR